MDPSDEVPSTSQSKGRKGSARRRRGSARCFSFGKGKKTLQRRNVNKSNVKTEKPPPPPWLCCVECWQAEGLDLADRVVREHNYSHYSDAESACESDADILMWEQEESRPHEYKYSCSPPVEVDSDDEVPSTVRAYKLDLNANFLRNLNDGVADLLSAQWTLSEHAEGFLRMCLLSSSINPVVEKTVALHKEGFSIFVHHKPLPTTNFIWNKELKDPKWIYEASSTVKRVADLVEKAPICKGVVAYKDFWDSAAKAGKGAVYEDSFFATACELLLTKSGVCSECFKVKKFMSVKFAREKKVLGKEDNLKCKSKTNNRYLSQPDLMKKTAGLQKQNRIQQKKIKRLEFRIKQLMKRDLVAVNDSLHQNLYHVMKKNEHKLSLVQKLFWKEQLKALSFQDKRRGMRWNPMMIRIALTLYKSMPDETYDFLREIIGLPAIRTLYDYSHVFEAKEGIQMHVLEDLQEKIKGVEEHKKYFNLQFDEMYVKSNIVMNRRTGDIIGYTNLTAVEKELKDFSNELNQSSSKPSVAKKILCYMVNGITSDIVHPVAIYPTSDISSGQLYSRTWDVISNLENKDVKVLTVTCDGAAINKKFFKMHKSLDPICKFVYKTTNIACGEDRPIFFFVDPPHILKTVRNCLANSGAHRLTRNLWKDGETMSWETLAVLYEICHAAVYTELKLTKDHIKLNSFSCMKVLYATQVLSCTVYKALLKFKSQLEAKGHDVEELAEFIRLMNRFFDCFNASGDKDSKRNKEVEDMKPYLSQEDKRLEFLKSEFLGYLDKWEESVLARPGNYNAKSREKMMISFQTVESLRISIHSLVEALEFLFEKGATSVDSRKFSQDKLEQFFGLLRMSFGSNTNPDVSEVLNKSLTLHAQGKATALVKRRGNTTSQSTGIEVDESPLPKRPRKK